MSEPTIPPWIQPIEALESFSARLGRGARVYCVDAAAASWFGVRGFEVELRDPSKDLRMLSLPRASLSGAWLGDAVAAFPIEEAQRILANFFKALQPKTGMLFVAHSYSEPGFASLLRQNGFEVLREGRRPPWQAITARRI